MRKDKGLSGDLESALKTATMWRESGENVIVTGIEPSGIDVPTGSSRAPVGSRYGSGASWRHPQNTSTAARANPATASSRTTPKR